MSAIPRAAVTAAAAALASQSNPEIWRSYEALAEAALTAAWPVLHPDAEPDAEPVLFTEPIKELR